MSDNTEGANGKPKPAKLAKSKTCFVIAPICEPGSQTRKRSDQVLRHIIEPAAEVCGYVDVQRADKLASPGVITSQVIQLLLDTDLVVADLTEHNANVFYELAIRHAVKKPIVQLIQSGLKIPFDVAQMRTISYNLADPDELLEAQSALEKQIVAVENNPSLVDNPITVAVDLKALTQSDDPVSKSNVEILTTLNELRNEMVDLRNFVVQRLVFPSMPTPNFVTSVSSISPGVWNAMGRQDVLGTILSGVDRSGTPLPLQDSDPKKKSSK